MFSDILHFLVNILFSLFGILLILRAWMHAIRLHPFNPYSQAIFRYTDWLVQPMRKLVSPGQRLDWPSLLAGWLTALVFLALSSVLFYGLALAGNNLVQLLVASVLTLARWAFNVLLWVTLIQAVLSWVNPLAPAMPVLQTLTAPLLDPIRRILPAPGGLDLSPLVLLVLAQVAIMIMQRLVYQLSGL